jgi:hypothetical protein
MRSALASLAAAIDRCHTECLDPAADQLGATLLELHRQATRLAAVIATCTQRAAEAEVWRAEGASSMTDWLAAETQCTKAHAKQTVRLGEALQAVPDAAALMVAGELSVDNALLVGAVATHADFADDTELLLDIARTSSPTETRQAFDTWRAIQDSDLDAEQRHALQREQRSLTFTPRNDGLVDVTGRLLPLEAATVQRALRNIAGAAFDDQSGRTDQQRVADALVELCDAYAKGTVTGGRERPTVLAVVPFQTLVERANEPALLPDEALVVSGPQARRLACDADIHRIITAGASVVLDMGRATRYATTQQYLALAARDGGCRWPGCERPPGWCDAHHIDEAVRDDGPTDLHNLALFCSCHHSLLHTAGWSLVGDAHDLFIRRPDGRLLAAPPRGAMALQLQLSSA